MGEKIKSLIFGKENNGKEEVKFSDIDPELRFRYTMELVLSVAGLVLGIIFAIFTKNISIFLLFTLLSLMYALMIIYRIYITLSGQLAAITGEYCGEYEPLKLKKMYKRRFIVIQDEGGTYIKIYAPPRFEATAGNIITVYTPISSIYQDNEDTLIVNNIYHIVVSRTGIKHT